MSETAKGDPTPTHPVVLFDGVCNLCDATVQFLIDRDPDRNLRFASLQSDVGGTLAREVGVDADALDTFVLVEPGPRGSVRSTAALRVTQYLRGAWPLMRVFLIVPAVLRDVLYKFVAKRRYRWFGKTESCRIPSPEEAARFIE